MIINKTLRQKVDTELRKLNDVNNLTFVTLRLRKCLKLQESDIFMHNVFHTSLIFKV